MVNHLSTPSKSRAISVSVTRKAGDVALRSAGHSPRGVGIPKGVLEVWSPRGAAPGVVVGSGWHPRAAPSAFFVTFFWHALSEPVN